MYQKLNGFSKKVSDLSDTPSSNLTPAQIKQWFDQSPEEMRQAFNKLVDDLNTEDTALKQRLSNMNDYLNSLDSMTVEQSEEIAALTNEATRLNDRIDDTNIKIAKQATSLVFDYSQPVAVSPLGIPYMFAVTDDGILMIEEKRTDKTYHSAYIKSPNGSSFQVYSEDDGTLVLYQMY